MKSIRLSDTPLNASVLGFGCNALLGDRAGEGPAMLEAAYDAGIRYFDVARAYGYGDAEALVGKFAKGRRDRLTIATKFGIEPLRAMAAAGPVKALVRQVMKMSPALRTLIGRKARTMVKMSAFDVASARRSLETSLRMLQTDSIDVYLLHDCTLKDTASPELLAFLEAMVKEGKIRSFGIGTGIDDVLAISRSHPEFASVKQFESSVLRPNVERLKDAPGAIVTHGALAGSYQALRSYLASNSVIATDWSCQIDADCTNPSVLAALMLNHAVAINGRGPVLFASRDPQRIRANANAVNRPAFSSDQLARFAKLALQTGVTPA
jgi:diketogulonate reductase-like aldo/keto reductase